jgi:hypothetical protein
LALVGNVPQLAAERTLAEGPEPAAAGPQLIHADVAHGHLEEQQPHHQLLAAVLRVGQGRSKPVYGLIMKG